MQYNVVMNTMHYHKHDRAPLSLYKHSTNTQSSILDHKNSGPKITSKRRFNAQLVLRQGRACAGGGRVPKVQAKVQENETHDEVQRRWVNTSRHHIPRYFGQVFSLQAHCGRKVGAGIKEHPQVKEENIQRSQGGCSNTTKQYDSNKFKILYSHNLKSKLQLYKGIQEGHMLK